MTLVLVPLQMEEGEIVPLPAQNPAGVIVVQAQTESGGSSSITIGTTPITGGTSGRLLYDNASKAGEIAPGTTVSAKLRVERHDFKDRIAFDIRNLPHGIVVDNILALLGGHKLPNCVNPQVFAL